MFGSSFGGARAYAKVGLETGVVAASPHQLIVMLFEGAIIAVKSGLVHMKARDFEKKGAAISKAIAIINEGMRASLDKKAGGAIAANLDSLYQYMVGRLLKANLDNDPALLDEVLALLVDLKSSWDAIGATAAQASARPPLRTMTA